MKDEGEIRPLAASQRPAVILLSGGLDSATTAAVARAEGFALFALSIDYGQRHRRELEAAGRVARAIGVQRHVTLSIDLGQFGGSALTDSIDVPKDRDLVGPEKGTRFNLCEAPFGPFRQIKPGPFFRQDIPITYVPARNTVFLSLALGYAEVAGAADIFIGANAVDYSGYPDCRPKYLAAFERMANLATKASVEGRLEFKIHAPLLKLTKAQIIHRGTELGVDYGLTHSCYDPNPAGLSCGHCDSCLLRLKGFAEAGLKDPLEYQ